MSDILNIGIFGRRNTGKSSLINMILGQDVSIVSDVAGTTTDPVKKLMELPGVGRALFIDTAGVDDFGLLGKARVKRTKELASMVDLAILIYTGNRFESYEEEWIKRFKEEQTPTILIHNQSDIIALDNEAAASLEERYGIEVIEFSCSLLDEKEQQEVLSTLLNSIKSSLERDKGEPKTLFHNLVKENDSVVLVCPIDEQAPKGRLILPQVNAIRDILDKGGVASVLQPEQLEPFLKNSPNNPSLVVTDSQIFDKVNAAIPPTVPLTSFSILLARAKGGFKYYLQGTPFIDTLKEGDSVLILESCSHHAACDDIGRVKIPALLKRHVGGEVLWDIVAGVDPLPQNLTKYKLAIQCGACMITNRQLLARLRRLERSGIPITNYGMAISWCMGIYERGVELF
ncbi:MAG: [FeFe] hydrogenase H-cluster maturation GTPase HydF [Bacteroidales bacterium]